jgi:prepilin-type N-terminal cleavage/methylation domain-containing protein
MDKRSGFTLTELLVVMGISVILLTLIIGFTRSSEQSVALFNEQVRLVSNLTRAKSLTLETFASGGSASCGYGIVFTPPDSYALFKDEPEFPETECLSGVTYTGNSAYDAGEELESFQLDPRIKFLSAPLNSVLFIPPDPLVVFNPSGASSAVFVVSTLDDAAQASVKVTSIGQITAQ